MTEQNATKFDQLVSSWVRRSSGHRSWARSRATSTGSATTREKVWDLDAVFHQLDSKAPPARREGLVGALDAHGRKHRAGRAGIVETDYFRVKVHKNQNVHFTVLDPVLLERFNALVQDHRRLCHRRPA